MINTRMLEATSPGQSSDPTEQEEGEGSTPALPAELQAGTPQRAPMSVNSDAEVVQHVTVQGGYVENIIGKVVYAPFTPRPVAATGEKHVEAAARFADLTTDTIPEPQDVLPPGSWMNSLGRNRQLVGREADLLALAALLKGGETVAVSQAQAAVANREESVARLRQHRPDLSDSDAEALAEELGNLPLALQLAGRFLQRHAAVLTPQAYFSELRSPRIFERLPLLKQDGKLPTGHERDVARTFALSFERLDPQNTEDALALRLLARVAFLAPGEAVPVDLFQAAMEAGTDDLDAQLITEAALGRLVGRGLIERETNVGVRIHRLVAFYVRRMCGEADAWAGDTAPGDDEPLEARWSESAPLGRLLMQEAAW